MAITEPVEVEPGLESLWLGMLTRFYRRLDSGDVAGLLALAHPALRWRRQGKELSSHDEISATLSQRPAGLHVFHILSGVVFEAVSRDHVRYTGYLTVLRAREAAGSSLRMPPVGAQSLHVCEGELTLTHDGWRISFMDAGAPRINLEL